MITTGNYSQETLTKPLTWVEIDLKAVEHNWKELNKLAHDNMTKSLGIMPVIKADAYGHGVISIAQKLSELGCRFFGVSNAQEGLSLREAGFKQKILLFESTLAEDASAIIAGQLTPTVCNLKLANHLDNLAKAANQQIPIHIKIDTGMGRLGVDENEAIKFILYIRDNFKNLILEGIYTHFPLADTDPEFTFAQMRRFRDIVYKLENQYISFAYIHAANSMGLGDYKSELFNLARPGLKVYGLYPSDHLKDKIKLKPVMSVKTRIIFVQTIKKDEGISYGHTFKAKEDTTIAVLPIGYSNGYLRALSNKAFVLIQGVRCPVVGRVTMDQIMVDISAVTLSGNIPHIGHEAVLIGRQKDQSISADELAQWADTINYEIVCALGSRLPRIIKD